MTSRKPNSGQYRDQPGHYTSPEQDTPSPNASDMDSQPPMDGFNGFYNYASGINVLPRNDDSQVSQTYPPAFEPSNAGPSVARFSRPIVRVPPTYQPPNLPAQSPPTGIWNPSITSQIPMYEYQQFEQSITSTPGFNVGDSAHGSAGYPYPMHDPSRETRKTVDLSHFYNDAVHQSYRNIRLKCHLKDPKGYQPNSKIIVRREKRVVLEMHLQADCERMGWKGIALPRTGNVKQSNQQPPTRLLYFSIEVHGSTTGMCLTQPSQPCDNCWRREMRLLGNPHNLPYYLIDFKSDSPFILFPRADTLPYAKAEVTFHFACYSGHQKEDYELVARLHDDHGNLVAYYQIPYSFRSVPKADKDGVVPDDYPPVPPVVSPVVATPSAAGPSTSVNPTASTRRPVNPPIQRPPPGGHYRQSNPRPIPPPAVQLPSVRGSARTDIQPPNADDQPLLQKVAPIEGPTRGGLNIVLIGTNFPPWPTIIYARFGSAVAATSWINPFSLECTLPTSPMSGIVTVTLSLSPDHNAPMFGRSLCTFTYREEQESFLLMLRSIYSQGHELSRVALDILIPQVLQNASPETLNHALRRLAQSQDNLPLINARELEELGVRFLATISDSPRWSDDLSCVDENRQTIAHLCVLSGYTRLLTKVVDWGIDLDVGDVGGLTALHCAYLREDWDCVRILKEAGANEYIEDNLGRIPRKMCQCVETEGTTHSDMEEPSTPAKFSSAGEEDWVDCARRASASPEEFTLLGRPHQPWRSPTISKATEGGICASPMPIRGPSSAGSSSAEDDWQTSFSSLHIAEPPSSTSPMTRAPSTRAPSAITSSSSRRGGGGPQPPQIHPTYPWVVPRAASAKHGSLPNISSFNPSPAFPMPRPAVVPLFPVAEPSGYAEESDDSADTPSRRPSPQRSSPSPVSSPMYRKPTLAPTSLPHATYTRPLAIKRSMPSQGTQPSRQPPPSTPGTGYGPPSGPPPSHSVPSQGVVPRSLERDEKVAILDQLQEIRKAAWPSADQEKEKMKAKVDQKPVTSEKSALEKKSALADLKVNPTRRIKVAVDHVQQPKQGEA